MKINISSVCLLTLFLVSGQNSFGQAYSPPEGGWQYIYDGDQLQDDEFEALDGDWTFGGGSDSWDRSGIGEDAPGGVSLLDDNGTSFLRLQDTGDPRDHPDTGVGGDPSNRKLFFDRDIVALDDVGEEFLEDGFTLSFRARIATAATGPIDEWYPDGGGFVDDWPAGGLGEHVIEFDSTAHISLFQPFNIGSIGFALTTEEGVNTFGENGLLMNDLNGEVPCKNCGDTGQGETNFIEIADVDEWHEFWVNIQGTPDGPGSHQVTVYMDGSTDGQAFDVTAGVRSDGGGQGPLSFGIPGTSRASAYDLDFIAIKDGLFEPGAAAPGKKGDFNGNDLLDSDDIDLLMADIRTPSGDANFDVNMDGSVNAADLDFWVADLKNTWSGDADLDGEFNSGDFVVVFTAGTYETGAAAGWAQGDWDGDGQFTSGDFVAAFVGGGYEVGPRPGGPNAAVAAVPEPSSLILLGIGLLLFVFRRNK